MVSNQYNRIPHPPLKPKGKKATDAGEDYWSEADCRFYKGAREWDERVKQWFIENK